MAFYAFDGVGKPMGVVLRAGLDDLRSARYKLAWILGVLNEMTNQQVADAFGFPDATVAGNAKAELQSDAGKLLSTDATTTAQMNSAVTQMLNQFG